MAEVDGASALLKCEIHNEEIKPHECKLQMQKMLSPFVKKEHVYVQSPLSILCIHF
jgi:hypothetical protein